MKNYPRILTVQDISCIGQCSLTVALPILSACGIETAILPSAVLSTHTSVFKGYTLRDLTDDMPGIIDHWEKEKLYFDAVYTGYLGSERQIDYVLDIERRLTVKDALLIVDPAMADNGVLYPAFDRKYVLKMKELIAKADIILPNITEACLLTGNEYSKEYDRDYISKLLADLAKLGAGKIILTGVSYREGYTGVVVYDGGKIHYYEHELIDRICHGTGDVYASVFTGALLRGHSVESAAQIAADITVLCIKNTLDDSEHWYGVKFETAIKELIAKI